jgi:murein DD-endopeptidase MepM/ murein hydrolase activator NlpD
MPAYPDSAARPGRGWWWLVLALLLSVGAFVPAAAPIAAPAAVVTRPAPPPTTAPGPTRVPGLWMPVAGAVVRGFDVRAGPYGAGHRGIDIAAPMGELVRTPAAGRVVFAGPVAGTTWVSVRVAQACW